MHEFQSSTLGMVARTISRIHPIYRYLKSTVQRAEKLETVCFHLPDLCNTAPAEVTAPLNSSILTSSPCNWGNETVSVPWRAAPYSEAVPSSSIHTSGTLFNYRMSHCASPVPCLSFSLNPRAAFSPKAKNGRRCQQPNQELSKRAIIRKKVEIKSEYNYTITIKYTIIETHHLKKIWLITPLLQTHLFEEVTHIQLVKNLACKSKLILQRPLFKSFADPSV